MVVEVRVSMKVKGFLMFMFHLHVKNWRQKYVLSISMLLIVLIWSTQLRVAIASERKPNFEDQQQGRGTKKYLP